MSTCRQFLPSRQMTRTVNDDPTTKAVISLTEVDQRQVTRAVVADNLCFARAGIGIQCISGDDVAIQGNTIVATGACTRGILLLPLSSDMDNISVRDNDIMGKGSGTWETGIQANSGERQMHHLSIVANSVRNAAEGIVFGGNTFAQTPVCALNRIDAGVTSPLGGLEGLPGRSLVVGGAASRGSVNGTGAGRFIAGLGDPNDSVSGNIGDIFQQLDGTPGKTLWVKESDNGTTTGWTAK